MAQGFNRVSQLIGLQDKEGQMTSEVSEFLAEMQSEEKNLAQFEEEKKALLSLQQQLNKENDQLVSEIMDLRQELYGLKNPKPNWKVMSRLYGEWLRRFPKASDNVKKARAHIAAALEVPSDAAVPEIDKYSPLISFIVPVYNTPSRFLKECIQSLRNQSYVKWELCAVDNGSTNVECRAILDAAAAEDCRVHVQSVEKNVGIAAASQLAIDAAQGDYIAFVDSDDILVPAALSKLVESLRLDPTADILYSDHAMMSEKGDPYYISFKPSWSPEFFISTNFITHVRVMRRSLAQKVGGFEGLTPITPDTGLISKLIYAGAHIVHVPEILYFWRVHKNSVTSHVWAKPEIIPQSLIEIQNHLNRGNVPATVSWPDAARSAGQGWFKLDFPLKPALKPAIIVPVTSDDFSYKQIVYSSEWAEIDERPEIHFINYRAEPSLTSIKSVYSHQASDQKEFDAIVNSIDAQALVFISQWSNLVFGAWLRELVGYLSVSPQIGAVGGKVLNKGHHVAAGGVLFIPDLPTIAFNHHDNFGGYWGNNQMATNVEAVSSLLMATSKKIYQEVGGLPVFDYRDSAGTAYGVKLRQKGYRVVLNPFSKSIVTKPPTRILGLEQKLKAEFGADVLRDRYYPPFFDKKRPYMLA